MRLSLELFDELRSAERFDFDPTAEYARHCNICDAIGHGYPGGGYCPLEDMGEKNVPEWAQ